MRSSWVQLGGQRSTVRAIGSPQVSDGDRRQYRTGATVSPSAGKARIPQEYSLDQVLDCSISYAAILNRQHPKCVTFGELNILA